jgi:hypothetical protein
VDIVVEGSLALKGYKYLQNLKYVTGKLAKAVRIEWETESDSALLGAVNFLRGSY